MYIVSYYIYQHLTSVNLFLFATEAKIKHEHYNVKPFETRLEKCDICSEVGNSLDIWIAT